ncbi:ABC transporter family substrate-binding protein [Corynebacterium sp. sy017]|uniref:ABC transporter family substrate-binding protein n=1 Tax=unclassified Corynebacterium TaxID=2624378 RepID=UPI0011870286|nr:MULTISPECIES: ABC transporter family substrate-binding protein [unclassified Corynebacterium]MBP3089234.1 ABC transporter family substrate-binding protein [Corynebacterium sp. sy017]TSD91059.1 ABC transporter family substrate-binding protein [Corynebacterium sp. SY003]
MKSLLRSTAIAMAATLSITLTACSSNGSDSAAGGASISVEQAGNYAPTERDKIKDGGTLTLAIDEIPAQLNDLQADSVLDGRTLWQTYNPVLILSDGAGKAYPNEDYITDMKQEVVDGKTKVTYTFNEKATFNDGTPIDWRSFETTRKFMSGSVEGAVPSSTDGYIDIESVTPGENDKQAVVTYTHEFPFWEDMFTSILHPSITTAEQFNTLYLDATASELGAGPFKVEKIDRQAGIATFVRNEKWWGDPAKLEKITYKYMSSDASINAFQAGEIDATGVSTKDRLKVAKDMGDSVDIRAASRNSVFYYTLNSKSPLLGDIKVREAIVKAVDRKQIATIRYNGLDYTEDLPGSFIAKPFQEYYEDNFGEVAEYNQEEAKKILDEVGWVEGSDGIREKDGQKLTIHFVSFSDDANGKAMDSAIQKMLKDIGVDLQIDQRPGSEFSNTMANRDFDMLLSGVGGGSANAVQNFGQQYLSDSELNKSGLGSAEFDEKIRELQKLPTIEEQYKRGNELEKEALAEYGLIPVLTGVSISAMKKGLVNFGPLTFATVPKEDIGYLKES